MSTPVTTSPQVSKILSVLFSIELTRALKGATVVGSIWYASLQSTPEISTNYLLRAVMRDETLYGPDVEKFNPDRFMKTGEDSPPHPEQYAFGFGRR